MNEEVKEILEALKPHNDIIKEYPLALSIEEQKLLLKYITNLQQETERLETALNASKKFNKFLQKENIEFASRCDKAIEYIKEEGTTYLNLANQRKWCSEFSAENILKILGGDEE